MMDQMLDVNRKLAVKSNSARYLGSQILCFCWGFNSV
ncbi:hypothetical protein LASUN_05950 [Lentilactobacillus sunkii]|uniref:Uncharacterized protein n=1 Tax=Lentilactobacillus sunkii TaxID=481719 RepID=A0A1E7XGR8_9LACO|nr:hypothetical protein LASUN_05950 [Lentilactobacillus sunkii]